MLEVCIDSLESVHNALGGGADELEVCSSLAQGGLTPSAGLVKLILDKMKAKTLEHNTAVKKPKVNVMLRCRGGSDFCYNEYEMDTMMADLNIFKQAGVDRFVFGALTHDRYVDVTNCRMVVEAAKPIPVTFHRAFDLCKSPECAIDKIIDLGFDRVLTSGQRTSAGDPKAIELIKSLVESHGHRIDVMPGAGINADNVKTFIDFGCKIVHGSFKISKSLPKVEKNILVMGTSDDDSLFITDENAVKKIKEIINV